MLKKKPSAIEGFIVYAPDLIQTTGSLFSLSSKLKKN